MIPFSVLDLSPIPLGSTARVALRNTLDLAQHAERWGYRRYWLAEHHNMPGIASAATSIVIGQVAAATSTIRVGSGGVMLPNHAPLVVAEQFGTLASLFPDRIDLGLGRAPGTDGRTARALRRDLGHETAEQFPQDVLELQHYFEPSEPNQPVRAVPGVGLRVPIWLLGSSLFSAQLAAMLGLPFAFASHFAPEALQQAVAIYRSRFQPSTQLDKPYVMIGVNVFAADTEAEAKRQFTSVQQAFIQLRRGLPGPVPPPVDNLEAIASPLELAGVAQALKYAYIGTPEQVQAGLQELIDEERPDELILAGHFYDHTARLRSYELAAEVRKRLTVPDED